MCSDCSRFLSLHSWYFYLNWVPSSTLSLVHYANMPMQYSLIFHGRKNGNFQMKNCDVFVMFAQNIDCGYTLEPPQLGGSNEYPQSMFLGFFL